MRIFGRARKSRPMLASERRAHEQGIISARKAASSAWNRDHPAQVQAWAARRHWR